jgi:type IV secretion system protein VirD4
MIRREVIDLAGSFQTAIQNHFNLKSFHMDISKSKGIRHVVLVLTGMGAGFMWLASYKLSSYFFSLALTAAFIFIKLRWKIKTEIPEELPQVHEGDAHWCSIEQFEETNNPNADFENGVWIGGRFTRSKFFNCVVIGGAGCGKTTSRLIPALLLQPTGSYVVVDIKSEISFTTARAQLEYGQTVYILDPFNMQESLGARHSIKPCGFNPFDFIKASGEAELIDMCASIAYFLCPDKPSDKDPFWVERSRSLIRTCILHIITGRPEAEHNFFELYKMLRLSGTEFINLLLDMKKNKALDGLISVAAEEWLGMQEAEATFMSIRANAQNATSIFESPQLRHCLSHSDFDPYTLAKDGNVTVYVVLPERYLDSHGAFLRMVIGLALKAVNARPGCPVHFHIDEFPALKKFEPIKHNFAFGRGQNIWLTIYAQSVAAMREVYGDAWEGFIANAAIIQLFGGARDQITRTYFSNLLGQKTVIKHGRSFGTNVSKDGSSNSTSTNYSTEKQPLLTPEQIGNVDGIITIADGKKIVLRNLPYFKNRYENVSVDAEWLDDEEKSLLRQGIVPTDAIHELFMQKADQPLRY